MSRIGIYLISSLLWQLTFSIRTNFLFFSICVRNGCDTSKEKEPVSLIEILVNFVSLHKQQEEKILYNPAAMYRFDVVVVILSGVIGCL